MGHDAVFDDAIKLIMAESGNQIPSISQIQFYIESAWKNGFDAQVNRFMRLLCFDLYHFQSTFMVAFNQVCGSGGF